ncbi:hypothetical protein [Paenibacillus sp. SI8]|uniref:hypothetical protein n=1 Tax=unclassified Paenibacillus TaxID=185978 RepID=UPI0034656BDA
MPNALFRYPMLYLLLTAAAGAVLRGMAFLPAWQSRYEPLLHAHSHIALLGWGYSALILLLAALFLSREDLRSRLFRTIWLLTQCTIVLMFLAFLLQGYGFYSILFSTIHILLSYVQVVWMWRKFKKTTCYPIAIRFAKASLLFMVLSSAGPWCLAVLSAKHLSESPWYHASLYFYLHGQYNGWFTLGLFAVLYALLEQKQIILSRRLTSFHYWGYTLSLLPSFLLSLLWMNLSPFWITIAVISGLLQLASVLAFFIMWIRSRAFISTLFTDGSAKVLLHLALMALAVKMVLETTSAIPALEALVFSTRSIVIGYLHLVLLGFVSCAMLAIAFHLQWLNVRARLKILGCVLFIAGFMTNELILFLDGLFNWMYASSFPFVSISLLAASLLMLMGIAILGWKTSFNKP